jgi:DNA-directed RNA polymerase subunit RPC12/RpoP
MKSQAQCPYCDRPISVWSIIKAFVPSLIRCSHCHSRIRVKNVGIISAVYFVALAAVVALLLWARTAVPLRGVKLILSAVVLLEVVELAISVAIVKAATLEKTTGITR